MSKSRLVKISTIAGGVIGIWAVTALALPHMQTNNDAITPTTTVTADQTDPSQTPLDAAGTVADPAAQASATPDLTSTLGVPSNVSPSQDQAATPDPTPTPSPTPAATPTPPAVYTQTGNISTVTTSN